MNLIPKFLRPYPTLRLFGRPIRQPDVKAVDPEPDAVRPDPWAAAAQRLREEGIGREPEPAHPDVVVLRVVETEPTPHAAVVFYEDQNAWKAPAEASVYRPVCSHEGLNEWGPAASLEQVTADIRAISIPALTVAEIMAKPDPEREAFRRWSEAGARQREAARSGTIPRDPKTKRFLPANKGNGR